MFVSVRRRMVLIGWVCLGLLSVGFLTNETVTGIDDDPTAKTEVKEADRPCLDWPKPALALVLTGRQSGYLEPCGCTGLENAKGGLNRRHSLLTELRKRGWDVAALDVGNQVRRYGVQAELKFQATANAFRGMEYDAVGLGPDDLRLSIGELAVAIAGDQAGTPLFISANVGVLDDLNGRYRVIERGGLRVGVTAVLGREEQKGLDVAEITLRDPVAAIQEVLPELQRQNCQLLILLAYASLEESRALARQFPQFGILVTAGGAGEPTREPEIVEGTQTRMIQVGTKGSYVGIVGLYPRETPRLRYERVSLNARFPDSPRMMELFSLYQQQLQDLGLAGLGLRPVRYPKPNRSFVGHETCGECHTTAYAIFEGTPHHHATKSISEPTERSSIPRHFDPECLSCHVTGWNPQGYFPYESGYLDLTKSAALHTNGCENCHGPGSAHVAVEKGEVTVSDEERAALRAQMRVSLEEARKNLCVECHDEDNSPDFDFDSYWPQIEHYGKD